MDFMMMSSWENMIELCIATNQSSLRVSCNFFKEPLIAVAGENRLSIHFVQSSKQKTQFRVLDWAFELSDLTGLAEKVFVGEEAA
jgi:hypothetical protein